MNFSLAISYVFDDQKWFKKIALTALLFVVPLIGQFYLLGWALEITRRVAQEEQEVLPEVAFGKYIKTGFFAALFTLIYLLPAILISAAAFLLRWIIGLLNMNFGTEAALITIVTICCSGLGILYDLIVLYWMPTVYANYANDNRFGAAFDFKKLFALLKSAPGAYVLVLLGSILAGYLAFIIGTTTVVIGILGAAVISVYAYTIISHLWGQAYKQAVENQALLQTPPPSPDSEATIVEE